MQIGMVILNAVFFSNIVTYFGSGIIGFQSDKKNFLYMLLSVASTIIGVVVGGIIIYFVEQYVLIPLDVVFLKTFIIVLIALIMSILTRLLIKHTSRLCFYIYERSYQFAAQTIILVGILLVVDLSQTFLFSLYMIAAYCAGYLLIQLIMYPLYDKIDSRNNFKPARNVPILLYPLGLMGFILTAVGMMF